MEQNKYSLASKRRWEQVPNEERKSIMSSLAKKKASMMTPEQRVEHAKMMRSRVGKKVV